MSDQDDARLGRPDGQRYDAPESEDERRTKEWAYAALGGLVLVLLVLIATGAVHVFPG